MIVKINSVLALTGGILLLLVPATLKAPHQVTPLAQVVNWDMDAKNKQEALHKGISGTRGLYGFWYKGF